MMVTTLTQPVAPRPLSGETNLRREFRLLTDVAFSDQASISDLLTDPALDWDYLMEAARCHGLIPVLAPLLLRQVSSVPQRVRFELQEASRRALEGTLALSGELVRVLRSLNQAQVECIPFKGPALAADLWGNFTLRQSMDIDLLVRPSQVAQAVEVLRACGYMPEPEYGWQKLLPRAVELQLKKPGMPPLELQWGVTPKCFAVDLPIEACWQRVRAAEFGGEPTLAFVTQDLLLILCIHGWKHAWNRLLWIADVARLMRKSTTLDWTALSARAEACGTEGILLLGVVLAQKLFGVSLPPEIENAVREKRQIANLADESIRYMQDLTQPSYTGWHRYMLAARERRSDRIRHISRFLSTPGVGDWNRVPLPKFVTPLYRFVRLARVGQVAAQYAFRRT
jgi:Uncharacterised nucleotidyltransferase